MNYMAHPISHIGVTIKSQILRNIHILRNYPQEMILFKVEVTAVQRSQIGSQGVNIDYKIIPIIYASYIFEVRESVRWRHRCRTDNVIRTDPNIERFFSIHLITHHLDLRLFLTFPFLISSNINLIERNGDPYHQISVHIQTQVQFLS